jgi:tripartite-type tricarboxylate transporter receptor subunit TctC
MNRRQAFRLGASALFATAMLTATPSLLMAQGKYPEQPIRLVVPFSPGGVVDLVGRLWADNVKDHLGTVYVDNKGGAGGTIGAGEVSRAAPDGYTVLLGNTSTQILNPAIMPKAPYDPAQAFRTVSILASSAVSIVVNPNVPAKTLNDLVKHIKDNPGKLNYGSPGTGTFTHLAGEMFKQAIGATDLTHIPYKGAGPGISDLVAGHIPMMVANVTSQLVGLHKAGKVRIVAVMTQKPIDALPDVPTAASTMPGVVAMLFTGLFVPAKTPDAIVNRIAEANRKAMASEAVRKRLLGAGLEPVLDTPSEAQSYVDAEQGRLLPLVKKIGFKLK